MPSLAVDLGSSNVRIDAGRGRVLQEPAIIAIDPKRGEIVGLGRGAQDMAGRIAPHIVYLHPLRGGVIADVDLTVAMLRAWLKRMLGWRRFQRPRAVVSVAANSTIVERRALREAAMRAGARDVRLFPAPVLAALGADLDIDAPTARLVVHVGGSRADAVILSQGHVLAHGACAIGGTVMDRAIARHLRETEQLSVDPATAEQIKMHVGPNPHLDIMGRDLHHLPRPFRVTTDHLRDAVAGPVADLAECVRGVLRGASPEVAADIAEHGMLLTGGGALLHGLDRRLSQATSLPVTVADEAATRVLAGAARVRDERRRR